MGVRLDEDEISDFLGTAHTGILSTIRRDGSPASVPMWFVMHDGDVVIRTLASSPKASNLRRDPRVSFLVESGRAWVELKAVVLRATARIVTDADAIAAIDAAFATKYEGFTMPTATPGATRRHYAADRIHVALERTDRALTWDNAKIRL